MRRSYSDEERMEALAALDANGGSLRKTARDTGVPISSLKDWRDGRAIPNSCAELRTQKKQALADRLEDIAQQVLGILPGKLQDASVRDLNGTLKIATEAMQLLRGEPTSINESRQDLTPDERARRIAAELERFDAGAEGGEDSFLAGRGAGGAVPADVPAVN
jgi:transposase-like protein